MLRTLMQRAAALAPGQCEVCHAWPARPVCEACVARFAQPEARCLSCALPVHGGATRCGRCLVQPPPLAACHAAVSYAYPWSSLITRFKFQGEPGWADTFATLMRSAPWVEPAIDAAQWVVPMPLSAQRLSQRGFNQAHELARRLAPQRCDAGILLRLRDTAPQTALDRQSRLQNVQQAFGIEPSRLASVRGRSMLLVDDVMTSGASLFSAAQALLQAGAAGVSAIVLARTDEPG